MKATGLREFLAHVRGETSLDEALADTADHGDVKDELLLLGIQSGHRSQASYPEILTGRTARISWYLWRGREHAMTKPGDASGG